MKKREVVGYPKQRERCREKVKQSVTEEKNGTPREEEEGRRKEGSAGAGEIGLEGGTGEMGLGKQGIEREREWTTERAENDESRRGRNMGGGRGGG